MRWGTGAGASRLISGIDDRCTGGSRSGSPSSRDSECGAAVRLGLPGQHRRRLRARRPRARSSSPTSSTTPASSTAAGSPRAETFVYRHADLEHLDWGAAQRRTARGADRHRRRLLDGRRRRAARASSPSSRGRHGCRLMVDEAHATGALGPGGRGSVAEAGLEDEVDVVVGTLGKALGGYGAYVCGVGASSPSYLVNVCAPVHLLDRAAARRSSPPALRGARAARRAARSGSSGCAANAEALRDGARAPRASRSGRRETQIVPIVVGDAEPRDGALRSGARARRLRPGDPAADGARGDVPAADDRDGDPPRSGAARAARLDRLRGARARASPKHRAEPALAERAA